MQYEEFSYQVSRAARRAESPIEAFFWHQMRKTSRSNWRSIDAQVPLGRFRVDALLEFSRERIAVELDGKEFHDCERDLARDQILLEQHGVTWVVRIPGSAIYFYPNPTMRVLAEWWDVFRIAWENTVMRCSELPHEISLTTDRDGCHMTEDEWLQEHGDVFDIWDAGSCDGYVATAQAALKGWRVRKITRMSAENAAIRNDCQQHAVAA